MVLRLILSNLLAELAVISSQKHKIIRRILCELNLLNFIMSYPSNHYFASLEPIKNLNNMAETMYSNNGIGLAAPQVGIPKKSVVIDMK
jgi:hypothetical protein